MNVSFLKYLAVPAMLFTYAALPASAGTITILSMYDANDFETTSQNGSSVNIPGGSTEDGLYWSGVGASVVNGASSDLGIYGTFGCDSVCYDSFSVLFEGTGFDPSSTSYVSMFGFTSGANLSVTGGILSGENETLAVTLAPFNELGYASSGNTTGLFSASSSPVVIALPGNFEGFLEFSFSGSGNVTLPHLSTADLFLTPASSVPEPGSLAIVAACGLLLFYVRRLRKA